MEVKKLVMREMPRYSDQYLRPYETNARDGRLIDALEQATAGGEIIEAGSISDISGRIIIPTSRVDGLGKIQNGWDEQRFMFMMEVVVHKSATSRVHMVISGYTDHSEMSRVTNHSRKGVLPDDLRFYFNSTYKLRTLRVNRGNEMGYRINTSDAGQILTRTERSDLSRNDRRGTVTLRPEDVIINNSSSEAFRDLLDDPDYIDITGETDEYRDTRPEFREAIKVSRRSNTNSSDWLANTLSALRDAEDDFAESDKSVAVRARGKVREALLENEDFWEELAKDSQIMSSGYVEWGELKDWNRDLESVTDVSAGERTRGIDKRGYSRWDDTTNEALAATIIKDTIIGYMIEFLYITVNFNVDNDTRGGRVEHEIGKFVPFQQDMDIRDNMNKFMSRVKNEMFKSLLFHRDMILAISVSCSIFGDIEIDISIDGGEEERFIAPAFTDSINSPVITNRIELIDDISEDIRGISRAMNERRANHRDNSMRDRILTGGRSDERRNRRDDDDDDVGIVGLSGDRIKLT